MLLKNFQVQLLLPSWEFARPSDDVSEKLGSLIASASSLEPNHFRQIKLQVCIMQVLLALRDGNIRSILDTTVEVDCENQSKPKRLPSIVRDMENLLQESSFDSVAFNMAPRPIMRAIVNLLSATLLRHQGKTTLALEYTVSGLEGISMELDRLGLGRQGVKQSASSWPGSQEADMYLLQRYLLLESHTQILLLRCDFVKAQAALVDIVQLIGDWPSLFHEVRLVHS